MCPRPRQSLRQVLSWCVQRQIFYSEMARLRDEFEKHRHEVRPLCVPQTDRLVRRA